jgi:hypothetical protein
MVRFTARQTNALPYILGEPCQEIFCDELLLRMQPAQQSTTQVKEHSGSFRINRRNPVLPEAIEIQLGIRGNEFLADVGGQCRSVGLHKVDNCTQIVISHFGYIELLKSKTTALASIASSRPTGPTCSPVLAFTLTWSIGRSSSSARRWRMAGL